MLVTAGFIFSFCTLICVEICNHNNNNNNNDNNFI